MGCASLRTIPRGDPPASGPHEYARDRRSQMCLCACACSLAVAVMLTTSVAGRAAAVTVTLSPVAATRVSQSNPNKAYGGTADLAVSRDEFLDENLALLRFDLSPIPANAVVNSAQLELYLTATSDPPPATVSIQVYRALQPWDAGTVTWNTRPLLEAPAYGNTPVGTTIGRYYVWPITALVALQVSQTATNRGTALRGPAAETFTRVFVGNKTANPARLRVDYSVATPSRTPTRTRTRTPTLTPTRTATRSPTASATSTRTPTCTATHSPTASTTPTRTATAGSTPTPTRTTTPTTVPSPTPSVTATGAATASLTPAVAPTHTPTPTVSPTNTSAPTETPDRQVEALRLLRQDSSRPPLLQMQHGLPQFVGVNVPMSGGPAGDPVRQALDFLDRYRDLYRLASPRAQLYFKRIFANRTGVHVFFGQHAGGIPIHAAEVAVHLRNGAVTHANGRYVADVPPFAAAEISARAAATLAAAAVPGTRITKLGEVRPAYYDARLGGHASGATRLAWSVHLRGRSAEDGVGTTWTYYVDANDGDVLHGIDDAPRAFQLSVIDADEESGEEEACLAGRGDLDVWFTEAGQTESYPGGDLDAEGARDASGRTYDFFAGLGIDSYDDRGARIPILVHVGDGWFNAKWETACNEMRVGDGMAGTDLIAHEFTHGVRQWSPNAQFDLDLDETFSLSESYADVFGCLVESGGAGAVDWVIGEDTALGAMADLSDPPRAPFHWVDHYDDYEGDDVNLNERHNSGITSKAAVLIVDGGTHHGFTLEGIGRDATRWLYLDTLLALTSNANMADVANETIHTAQDYADIGYRGFGSRHVCTVRNAFAAVGLARSFDRDCDGIRDVEDLDADGDGVAVDDEDRIPDDNCPLVENPGQQDCDEDGIGDVCDDFNRMPECLDSDDDGLLDRHDNCPCNAIPDQLDHDEDGEGHICHLDSEDPEVGGDVCDVDDDDDGVRDEDDSCPWEFDPAQDDTDDDGAGDACDNCPSTANANQADYDHDGFGDACDIDDDNDGICDHGGPVPEDLECRGLKPPVGSPPDACCRGPSGRDDCQFAFDPEQIDIDRNGRGLRCDSDEAEMLSGNWVPGVDLPMRFGDAAEAFVVPIAPCSDLGCPDWFPADLTTSVEVVLPFSTQTRIIDDRGFEVARGGGGMRQRLEFAPAGDAFYRVPGAAGGERRSVGAGEVYRGTQYYLAVVPPADVEVGREYTATVTVRTWRRPACVGDCNLDGVVTVDDLLRMVTIAAGDAAPAGCPAGDVNGDDAITIDEILHAVGSALGGCGP